MRVHDRNPFIAHPHPQPKIIEIIGSNTINQNQLIAQMYEKEYSVSLAKDLEGKCGPRLFYALSALLLTKPDFLAMRLHDAMQGWGANQILLTRIVGGLDGDLMAGVNESYQRKYYLCGASSTLSPCPNPDPSSGPALLTLPPCTLAYPTCD